MELKDKLINEKDIAEIAIKQGVEYAFLKAFLEVEANGRGFDVKTGKILIQFEPHLFKRNFKEWAKDNQLDVWENNKVDVQSKEWEAFNSAFKEDQESALKSTSIGLPQILGEHYKRLGYKTVGEMWDDFKAHERNQVLALVKFLKTDAKLWRAVQDKNWHLIASYYNGKFYKDLAKKLGTDPYDLKLERAYNKHKKTGL